VLSKIIMEYFRQCPERGQNAVVLEVWYRTIVISRITCVPVVLIQRLQYL
jgi:hypothetical protein